MVEKAGKLFIVFIFLPFIVYANPAARDGLPIISKINHINNQLGNITFAIGKKKPESSRFRLKNTSKRELYYTLLALYDKVNRFNFEVTGIYILPPKNIDEVKDEDISSLLDKIIGMIGQSSDNLKISKEPFEVSHSISRFDIDKSFNNVIYANIQIENILYQKTSPREVYKDVSQANKNILYYLRVK